MANLAFNATSVLAASKVVRAGLTADTDLDSGVLQETAGDETYNPFVPAGATTGQWVQWTPSAGEATALESVAHIHFEVESSFLSKLSGLPSSNRLFTLGSGAHKAVAANNSLTVQLDGVLNDIYALVHLTDRSSEYAVLDVLMTATSQDVYVDGLLLTQDANALAVGDFATLSLAASQIGTEKWDNAGDFSEGFRNVYVYSAHQLASPAVTQPITAFGDSFVELGGFPAGYLQAANQDNNGTGGNYDQGQAATIFKLLAENGIDATWTSHAISGAKIDDVRAQDLVTQIAAAAADLSGSVAFVGCGVNDTNGAIGAAFKSAYQDRIDELTAKSVDHIWIWTVASRVHADPYVAQQDTNVDDANAIIWELEAENANVSVFDVFTAMGGHSAAAGLFVSSDSVPHPTLAGHRVIGESFTSAYLSRLAGGKSNVITAAGTVFAISPALPATHDVAGFAALTYTDIAEIVDGGTAGKTFNKVDHSPLSTREVLSIKGSYNQGVRALQLGRDISDAGQALVIAQLELDTPASFKITYQNGDVDYATATVDSYTDDIGTIDTIIGSGVSITQCLATVRDIT